MNVNEKGVMGLLKVTTDLYSRGYTCFTPIDDYNPVDCIAMKDGKLYRLQVKYRSSSGNTECYNIKTRRMLNRKNIQIDRNLIDGWAIYLANRDKVVYLSVEDMVGKKSYNITEERIELLERGPDGKAADC